MMKKMLSKLCLFLTALTAFSPCFGEVVVVLNNGGSSVSVFDETTFVPIPGSPFPTSVPFLIGQAGQDVTTNPTGTMVYIANQNIDPNNVIVLDGTTFIPIPGSPFPSGGVGPISIAVNSAGTRVYVSNNNNSTISALDAVTLAIVAGPVVTDPGGNPSQVVIHPSGTRVYVANFSTSNLSVFDANLVPVVGSPFAIGGMISPNSMAIDSSGTRLYITGYGSNDIAILDPMTLAVITGPVPTGGIRSIKTVLNPAETLVYVANASSNDISVLDAITLAPVPGSPFPIGSTNIFGMGMNPAGTHLYVGETNAMLSTDVLVLDPITLTPVAGSPLTAGINIPISFAFSPLSLSTPPTNLKGYQRKNEFGVEFERFNLLEWDAGSSSVFGYFVYRDGVKIATLDASDLKYEDHNRKKGVATLYSVTSFDSSGNESTPVSVTVQ